MATTTTMASTATAPTTATMAPMQRATRPYRDYLTPFLHRQFTSAALLTLCVCYADAVWMGNWHPIWKWFPLGPAGLRTLMIFISSLVVFILRVAQLHVGSRATNSPFGTFILLAPSYAAVQTVTCYVFSAWWFSEIYIWSSHAGADLGWIDQGRSYERPRLNERPIYLRSLFIVLGLTQSIVHLYKDYDKVTVPLRRADDEAGWRRLLRQIDPPFVQIRSSVHQIVLATVFRVLVSTIVGLIIYGVFLRPTAWHFAFLIARSIWSLPKSAKPSTIPPVVDYVTIRFVIAGSLLVLLWELINVAFSAYVAQEPLKKGRPLTEDSKAPNGTITSGSKDLNRSLLSGSKDPNGSLLSGLQSKKEVVKAFAFWELNVITQRFPERRKTIFQEIDRAGGSTWSQILNACLGEIIATMSRMQAFQKPSPPPDDQSQPPTQPSLQTLPKISQPLKEDNIFRAPPPPANRRQKIERTVGTLARSYGQTPGARPITDINQAAAQTTDRTKQLLQQSTDMVLSNEQQKKISQQSSHRAKKLLQYSTDKLMSDELKRKLQKPKDQFNQLEETLKPKNLKSRLNAYVYRILGSSIGQPFRQTFTRRAAAVVLGTPHTQTNTIVDAAQAITTLAVQSLKEDDYGQVAKDVPNHIRTLTSTINRIENFLQSLQPHWSDVDFEDENRWKVEGVNLTLRALKDGLEEVLGAFGEYFEYLEIRPGEVRMAKECLRDKAEEVRERKQRKQERREQERWEQEQKEKEERKKVNREQGHKKQEMEERPKDKSEKDQRENGRKGNAQTGNEQRGTEHRGHGRREIEQSGNEQRETKQQGNAERQEEQGRHKHRRMDEAENGETADAENKQETEEEDRANVGGGEERRGKEDKRQQQSGKKAEERGERRKNDKGKERAKY